ncbi:helix-turn-helix domain-containing protein [Immundisolibacter sp.]|uniref:helix-turn-helix domain-containing protein n=1 Tax=Immundisolibacter sp. TaxID=1934948 RepID=UPI002636FD1B|nr:helix-turn-helix domain-containing protein [Immundisolibacter sp.]MDD3652163.1 helix-turn-helix domain-containing protein [Immundisolibacter sp.]
MRWWLDRLERWQAHEPDFMTLRQVAGITRKEVAALCGVKEATVRQWEAAEKSPPRAIVLLLHLSGGQLGVLDPAWKDWHLRAGQLWAPHLLGRGFTPEHLKVYEYAFKERDQLRRDLDRLTAQRPDEAPENQKSHP